jgi:N-acetylated-alpha-linked acidic dipeptidase
MGFAGPYGVYHAISDDFYWMESFGDPTFQYAVAATQVLGTVALRLADADVLPLDYEEYGEAIQHYLHDLKEEMSRNNLGDKLRFEGATRAATGFTATAKELEWRIQSATARGVFDQTRLETVNGALLKVERDFLLPQGLPGRAWFRHTFYAPGVYTGYAAAVLPGVREAVARKDWVTAEQELGFVQGAIERGRSTLNQALQALAGVEDTSHHPSPGQR